MTIFYQLLMDIPVDLSQEKLMEHFGECFYTTPSDAMKSSLLALLKTYAERRKTNKISISESRELMKTTNPRFILRNYLMHQAIEELEEGHNDLFEKLRAALRDPYSDQFDEFLKKRPVWASNKAGCSMLSCSS